jgi:hypothetical protein
VGRIGAHRQRIEGDAAVRNVVVEVVGRKEPLSRLSAGVGLLVTAVLSLVAAAPGRAAITPRPLVEVASAAHPAKPEASWSSPYVSGALWSASWTSSWVGARHPVFDPWFDEALIRDRSGD